MTASNPARGWRVDRIPGKRMTATDDGVLLPLWLLYDGKHKADAAFRLSLAEAEQLHAELCYSLGDGEAPACRPAPARWP
ncbi:hypothetical protein [Streptomyces ureilyticus]|uniref:MmyB-like transcription regulator ligand binding domain-containing protein n=1 Tax=Streptomyces ureilyticus TaxID=1775131 RepID=A0ABX0DNR0_9ACTN|nr:hypothetical protein [Streptomyces ureilyticus]NGO41933.1 hypothetical protein [Streptomyces ureilyticus]